MSILSFLFSGFSKPKAKRVTYNYFWKVSFIPSNTSYTLQESFYATNLADVKKELSKLYPEGYTDFNIIERNKQL